jgi:hypothetical protein
LAEAILVDFYLLKFLVFIVQHLHLFPEIVQTHLHRKGWISQVCCSIRLFATTILCLSIIYVQSGKFSINVLDTSRTERVLGNRFHWSMMFNCSIFDEGGTDVWTFYLYRSHDSSQWWGWWGPCAKWFHMLPTLFPCLICLHFISMNHIWAPLFYCSLQNGHLETWLYMFSC